MPEKGLHEYIDVAYGNNKIELTEQNEKFDTFLLNGGILLQPSLSSGTCFSPYLNIAATVTYSNITIFPNSDSMTSLQAKNLAYNSENPSYGFEAICSPGFLFKYSDLLVMLYGQSIFQYESGDYFQYRKLFDGIGMLYNSAALPYSYGFGVGLDIQQKLQEKIDIGISVETKILFNQTQSYMDEGYENGKYTVQTKEGGVTFKMSAIKLEPYVDYNHLRVSLSKSFNGPIFVCLAYRW